MFGECHAHLFMNGQEYKKAVETHKDGVKDGPIKEILKEYQARSITFVRDGGDAYGVSKRAGELAKQYDIDYRTPIFAIHKSRHYGGIVGREFSDWKEYQHLVEEVRKQKGDFIKIMVSGLADFNEYQILSEAPLNPGDIKEMIHIAHEEGFAVMVHANGREAILPAVEAGADSIEHGYYMNQECIQAMKEKGTVWVPTIVTVKNLIGSGRYPNQELWKIFQSVQNSVRQAYEAGVNLALGSDAGAYRVPHGRGVLQEYFAFREIAEEKIGDHLKKGESIIKSKFQTG